MRPPGCAAALPNGSTPGPETLRTKSSMVPMAAETHSSTGRRSVETVDARRTSWRYLLARSFAFGQGATQAAANAKPRRLAGIAFWMAVGLGQMFVFGTAAIVTSLIGSSSAAGWLDRAVQGAGKLFWVEAFEPRFYGEAAPAG